MRKPSPLIKAALINLVVFVVYYLLLHPIYDSTEDVNVLYMLGGGWGSPPTEILHYDQGLHPFLNIVIQYFFLVKGNVNWYTLALIATHFIFCTIVLGHLISQKRKWITWLAYAAIFIVFEGYFMLYPDFTSASIILSAAALLLLLTRAWNGKLATKHYVAATFLFLLGSFFRLETMIVVPGIALPLLALTVPFKTSWKLLGIVCFSAILIVAFNKIHRYYYSNARPGWEKEEAYRQNLFRFFNESSALHQPVKGEKWYEQHQLVYQGIIMDTNYLPTTVLNSMHDELKKAQSTKKSISKEWAKWFFINNRLFFAAFVIILLIYARGKMLIPALAISLIILLIAFYYLLFNAKAPPYILIAPLSFLSFAVLLYGRDDNKANYLKAAALLLVIAWGLYRLYGTSNQNKLGTKWFKERYAEISNYPNYIFIPTKDFYLHDFYVFDTPSEYRLSNVLGPESFLNSTYKANLSSYYIRSIQELIKSPRLHFWGEPGDGLKKHLEDIAGRPLQFSQPSPQFKIGKVVTIIYP